MSTTTARLQRSNSRSTSQRSTANGGWYWIENELLDPDRYPELDVYDIAVYNALACRLNGGKEGAGCFPSRKDIARHARCSPRKVRDSVKKLDRLGIIDYQERRTGSGRQTSHVYRLPSLKEAHAAVEAATEEDGPEEDSEEAPAEVPEGAADTEETPDADDQRQNGVPAPQAGGGCTACTPEGAQHAPLEQDGEEQEDLSPASARAEEKNYRVNGAFDWLTDVGDEDKIPAARRAAQRLLNRCPPRRLRKLELEAALERAVEATYGAGALDALNDIQREHVVDTLARLYEDGDWTRPVAACAVAALIGLDLERIGGVVRGWDKANANPQSRQSSGRNQADAGGNSTDSKKQGSSEDGRTIDRPQTLEEAKQWARENGFSARLGAGLWRSCGQYGWRTKHVGGPLDEEIRNLAAFTTAHRDELLRAVRNGHARNGAG